MQGMFSSIGFMTVMFTNLDMIFPAMPQEVATVLGGFIVLLIIVIISFGVWAVIFQKDI